MEEKDQTRQTYEIVFRDLIGGLRSDIRTKIVPFMKEGIEEENKIKEKIKKISSSDPDKVEELKDLNGKLKKMQAEHSATWSRHLTSTTESVTKLILLEYKSSSKNSI